MKFRFSPTAAFIIALVFISIFYLLGVMQVPFHPDESTYLYTSVDVELFWQNPSSLFWRPELADDPLHRYRTLDAPLVLNIIAVGRWVTGQAAPDQDWDWAGTWEENRQLGALPSQDLLMAGRLAVAALFPFSMIFLYLTARRISGEFTAWGAALLLATNALILLHTRRAMAEGVLVFGATLMMWSLVKFEKRVWLTGIPAALAFSAKQTLMPLGIIGLLAAIWQPGWLEKKRAAHNRVQITRSALIWGVLFIFFIALLHPFLWGKPIQAVQAALRNRQTLAAEQAADRAGQVLDTPAKKLIAMIGSLYLTQPVFAETGNYADETRASELAYLANPVNSLFRSMIAGGILLTLDLFGFISAWRKSLRVGFTLRRRLILLLTASTLQTLALLVMIPLPWQRYYMPMVPFSCLWIAYGVNELIQLASTRNAKKHAALPH